MNNGTQEEEEEEENAYISIRLYLFVFLVLLFSMKKARLSKDDHLISFLAFRIYLSIRCLILLLDVFNFARHLLQWISKNKILSSDFHIVFPLFIGVIVYSARKLDILF